MYPGTHRRPTEPPVVIGPKSVRVWFVTGQGDIPAWSGYRLISQSERRARKLWPSLTRCSRLRGKASGTYRYWRDTGYTIGALLLGGVAQLADEVRSAMWLTAALVVIAGLWIAKDVRLVQPHRQKS